MPDSKQMIDQARLLVGRLERISVDSIWSRRSSGARGGLLRLVERYEREESGANLSEADRQDLELLMAAGYTFLARAAQERLRK